MWLHLESFRGRTSGVRSGNTEIARDNQRSVVQSLAGARRDLHAVVLLDHPHAARQHCVLRGQQRVPARGEPGRCAQIYALEVAVIRRIDGIVGRHGTRREAGHDRIDLRPTGILIAAIAAELVGIEAIENVARSARPRNELICVDIAASAEIDSRTRIQRHRIPAKIQDRRGRRA